MSVRGSAFDSARMRAFVRELAARGQMDKIFVFSGQMAQFVPPPPGPRFVMDFGDVDSEKFASYAEQDNWPMGWVHAREARRQAALACQFPAPFAQGIEEIGVHTALGFRRADRHHLRREIPLVDGAGGVEPLVALEPDQPAAERLAERLGDLGLADAGLALEEQGPAHAKAEEDDGGQRPVGDIAGAGQEVGGVVDGGGQAWHGRDMADRAGPRKWRWWGPARCHAWTGREVRSGI